MRFIIYSSINGSIISISIISISIISILICILIFGTPIQILAEEGTSPLQESREEVSGVWEKINDFSEKAIDTVFKFLKNIWQGIGDGWKKHIQPWTKDFWNNFKNEFEKEMDETKEDTYDFFKDLWNKILEKLKLKKY